MAAIFISHSSLDDAQAEALKSTLAEIGFAEIFLDFDKHQGIPLGSDWESRLYREMERCQAVLLILTKNWLDSKWCFAEFAQARALGKTIFVVVETPRGETAIANDLQICDLALDRAGGMERLRHALKESLLVAQAGFAFPGDRAPYPGLVSFDAADAAVFFGRDQEVASLYEWARSERSRARKALALVGGSGTGKSSLLKAGVLPRLQRERGTGSAPIYLIVPPLRPGESPMREWLAALRTIDPTLTRADVEAATTPEAARDLIDRLRVKADAFQAVLVVGVDQAEELFAAKDKDSARAFLAALTALIAGDNPARLLLTIRADHIDDLQKEGALGDALELFPVKPMPVDRLPEIIRGPARRVDLTVEDALVEAIRADATSSDALPLVAFLLRELYDRYGKAARRLERAHYDALRLDALSPLEAAVRAKADETVERASPEAMAALRDAFAPGLVRLDEDRNVFLRRPAARADLPAASLGLIDALVSARLLVEDRDDRGARVEVAHEALFRVWPTLAGWLAEEREFLIGKSRVERLFADYKALPEAQRVGGLLTGVLLERARAWLTRHPGRFHDDEAAFIRASAAEADRIARDKRRAARRLVIASATAAAVFAIFGGVALWQRNVAQEQARIAEEQRARAERALTAATDAANGMVFDLAEKYRYRTDASATLVADIVNRALALQDTLLAAGEQSPKLRRSEMAALNERSVSLLTLGNTADAVAASQKSLTIARDLAQNKGNVAAQDDLAVSLERAGDAKTQAGDRVGALAAFEEELAIRRELAKDKGNAIAQRGLSVVLNKIGDARTPAGDRAGALAAYQESLAIRRDLAKDKGNARAQRDLSVSLNDVGDATALAGDRAGALAFYEESLAIARSLATDKGNALAQRDLFAGLERIGAAKAQAGDGAGALAAYQESLAIARDLAKDKGNAAAQRDLSFSLMRLGDVKAQAGDRAGALAAYQESLAIRRDLAKDKGNAAAQRDLSVSLNNVGDAKALAGDRAGALAAYQEGLAIARELAKDKGNAQAQRDLSFSLNKVGDAETLGGDRAGALAAYQESLTIRRDLAKDKGNPQAQYDLSVSLDNVGDGLARVGDRAGALAAYQEGLAIARDLAKDKGNLGAQRNLSVSLERVGDAKSQAGDRVGALAAYQECLALRRELAKDQGNALAQRDLAVILVKFGDATAQTGDRAGALAVYQESLAIRRALAKDKGNAQAQSDLSFSLVKVGDVKAQTSDPAGALAAYQESLALRRELAKDKGAAQAQSDLASVLISVGDAKTQTGDRAGALAAFQESLAIARDLVKETGAPQAQRSLLVALERIGDADLRAGDRTGALAAYEEELAIARNLAKDKGAAQAQRDLSVALAKVGAAKRQAGDLAGALPFYEESLTIRRALAADKGAAQAQRDLSMAATQLGGLAYDALIARQFDLALAAADQAVAAAPGELSPQLDRAHALMFLGRLDEARALYLAHRGALLPNGKTWEAQARDDFAALRKSGLDLPAMKEIEDLFAAGG